MSEQYHAVMIGEDGMEFGADVRARDYQEARLMLREMYPESRIEQLESPADAREREERLYRDITRGVDYDDEGRPFYPHGYYPDDD